MATTTKTTRRCKIHSRYQPVSNHWHGGRDVPRLRIGGLWMEQVGFKIGDPIEITVKKGKLIIKKAPAYGHRHN